MRRHAELRDLVGAPVVVVVPLRSFGGAKSRLGAVLDDAARTELVRAMAARVLDAAGDWPACVVTDDDTVAAWARGRDAGVIRSGPGLDRAVGSAVTALVGVGVARVVVAHADLPRAASFDVFDRDGVVVAPDRHRIGSNVVAVPTDAGFTFAYGPGSFGRHLAEARRLGLPLTIVDDPDLAWDVDEPTDLAGLPPALRPRHGAAP